MAARRSDHGRLRELGLIALSPETKQVTASAILSFLGWVVFLPDAMGHPHVPSR